MDRVQTSTPSTSAPAAKSEAKGSRSGLRVQLKSMGYQAGANAVRAASSPMVQRQVNPELDYNHSAGGGGLTDPEQGNGRLPFGGGGWDATALLSQLSQVDNDASTLADSHRCSAVAILAGHIQAGPAAVSAVATDTARILSGMVAEQNQLSNDVRAALTTLIPSITALPGRLTSQRATFQDLRRLSEGMFLSASPDPSAAPTTDAQEQIASRGGGVVTMLNQMNAGFAKVEELAGVLPQAGRMAVILSINTNTQSGVAPEDLAGSIGAHAVTLGANAAGQVYLYDPWPRSGSQILLWDSNRREIQDYFEERDGTQRLWRAQMGVQPPGV